jgi:hypothetical protein
LGRKLIDPDRWHIRYTSTVLSTMSLTRSEGPDFGKSTKRVHISGFLHGVKIASRVLSIECHPIDSWSTTFELLCELPNGWLCSINEIDPIPRRLPNSEPTDIPAISSKSVQSSFRQHAGQASAGFGCKSPPRISSRSDTWYHEFATDQHPSHLVIIEHRSDGFNRHTL